MVQEWDAAFKVDDMLYLCEAKHNMTFQLNFKDIIIQDPPVPKYLLY
jgi:hypothetical protein